MNAVAVEVLGIDIGDVIIDGVRQERERLHFTCTRLKAIQALPGSCAAEMNAVSPSVESTGAACCSRSTPMPAWPETSVEQT